MTLALAAPAAADPLANFDVRDGASAAAATVTTHGAAPQSSRATVDAREQLAVGLGDQAVVQTDPVNGTLRTIQRLDGALTDAEAGNKVDIAWAYVRDHAAAIGLTDADLATFSPAASLRGAGGLVVVQFVQSNDGIPSFDNLLKVGVDRAGRVVSVTGSPNPGLAGVDATPTLSATDALQAALAGVAVRRTPVVRSGPAGARRATTFDHDDRAELVLFGDVGVTRPAWRLLVHAASDALYDVVVDAANGDVLYRANLVDADAGGDADVFPAWPGRGPASVDLTPFLNQSEIAASGLAGANVIAWADITDDNVPSADEIIHPDGTGSFAFPTQRFSGNASGLCEDATKWCTWDGSPGQRATSWQTNLKPSVVNMFWLVNVFHEHLAAVPFGFDSFSGPADRIRAQGLDGALSGPDDNHLNNANMATFPVGQGAQMQMYLVTKIGANDDRDIDFDFDPAVVWHEYGHGLSNRLITDATGYGALRPQQSGSMGEGWSDWYALDAMVDPPAGYPISQIIPDDPAVDGDVYVGAYSDAGFGAARSEATDCRVGATSPRCPKGGYTYADFGKVIDRPEVHADGEIWTQTLWDLRRAVPDVTTARQLITDGMRLTTPKPSFLDARNAILAAAAADYPGDDALVDTIWQVFAHRGMGFFAGAADASDVTPVADTSLPPAAGSDGTVRGSVTDDASGAPVSGASVVFGGHEAAQGLTSPFVTTTDATGAYAMTVPAGTYPDLTFRAPGYDTLSRASTAVTAGATTTQNQPLRRDWATLSGGATIAQADDPSGPCGPNDAFDGSTVSGWSSASDAGNRHPAVTLTLPRSIDISAIGVDPTEVCQDGPSSTLKDLRVFVQRAGDWQLAYEGSFVPADRHRLNLRTLNAGMGQDVTQIRFQIMAPQNTNPGFTGREWIDVTDLRIYGVAHVVPSGGGGGGGGGGSTVVTIPPATPEPPTVPVPPTQTTLPTSVTVPPRTEPSIAAPPRAGRNGAVTASADCTARCTITATFTGDRALRRLLGAPLARTVLRTTAGQHRIRVALTRAQRQKLRAARRRTITVTLKVDVREADGDTASRTRRVTIRL